MRSVSLICISARTISRVKEIWHFLLLRVSFEVSKGSFARPKIALVINPSLNSSHHRGSAHASSIDLTLPHDATSLRKLVQCQT
jgi:hypothetical protein